MYNKFYKKKNKFLLIDKQKINKNKEKVKFCIFAGRKRNLDILNKYIILLLDEKIIDEYHIFDFTRNNNDKEYLYKYYLSLKNIFNNQIFIYNENNKCELIDNLYDWSPFYKTISCKKFYKNSIIIKCDDDILFIDIIGLKNAIIERKKDKKSFLLHSNCINNNICAFYQKHLFESVKENLKEYPDGGILGPIFNNPYNAYIMQYEFLKNSIEDYNLFVNYYIKDAYINTRISINFIILNGEDCKYLKNVSFNDEYELSSYYPEKLLRPNRIIGNFITCHYSYSLQEKLLSRKNDLYMMYLKFYNIYKINYKKINYDYNNIFINKYKINKISRNKFYINNPSNNKYIINDSDGNYMFIQYYKNKLSINKNKKTYFDIKFIENNLISIHLGIYKFNKYNIEDKFTNRNLLIKLLNNKDENLIELIPCKNYYYFRFKKNKLYINQNNHQIIIESNPRTLWNYKKVENNHKIYVSRFVKNKKFYYKNLKTGNTFTNFYMGWGNENILNLTPV